ncbi:MAG: Fe-S cluster assembly protein SufD [Pseudomonadota bacterium]|nr:Fe-S cluster assembly protein SufD [Pseudomonadota bacterium]
MGNIALFAKAPLVALNTAFMAGGFVLMISEGVTIERPIQIIHFVDCPNTDFVVHPRNLIVAGENSSAEVVETYLGSINSRYWTNAVTEIRVGQNAIVSHLKRQSETKHAYHTARTQVYLDKGADYRSVAIATGAELSRNEISVLLDGSGAKCMLAGGTLIRANQHCDNTTTVDHRVPGTASRQVFRNVLDDKSSSVFQGGIIVRPNAQKTDGSQSSRSLLLAPGAQANTKPELKIFADDVKCAHGATVGELDQDSLFYLQSRGLPIKEAKSLLIEAFVNETLGEVRDDILRDHLFDAVVGWMNVADESSA